MPVDRVVAEIRFTAHEPLRKRRSAEITNLLERFLPMNRFSLFGPEGFPLFQGASAEFNRSGWLIHWGWSNGVLRIGVMRHWSIGFRDLRRSDRNIFARISTALSSSLVEGSRPGWGNPTNVQEAPSE